MPLPDKNHISLDFPALPPIKGLTSCSTVKELLALNIRYCSRNLINIIDVRLDGRWMCVYGYREPIKKKTYETASGILIKEGYSKESVEPLSRKIDLCKHVKEYKDDIKYYDRQEEARKKEYIENNNSKKNLANQ